MFPWVIIHNIKPNHVDYYHIEGFWDCSMYVRNKYGVKIHTWVETPCTITGGRSHGKFDYHLYFLCQGHENPKNLPT